MGDDGQFSDPFYRDLCSARTLQADVQQGFFAQLAEHVAEEADADWLASFAAMPSDEGRVATVYAIPEVRSVLSHASPVFRGKDAVVSRQRRVAGDRAMAEGKLDVAVALYSQAVVRAPVAFLARPTKERKEVVNVEAQPRGKEDKGVGPGDGKGNKNSQDGAKGKKKRNRSGKTNQECAEGKETVAGVDGNRKEDGVKDKQIEKGVEETKTQDGVKGNKKKGGGKTNKEGTEGKTMNAGFDENKKEAGVKGNKEERDVKETKNQDRIKVNQNKGKGKTNKEGADGKKTDTGDDGNRKEGGVEGKKSGVEETKNQDGIKVNQNKGKGKTNKEGAEKKKMETGDNGNRKEEGVEENKTENGVEETKKQDGGKGKKKKGRGKTNKNDAEVNNADAEGNRKEEGVEEKKSEKGIKETKKQDGSKENKTVDVSGKTKKETPEVKKADTGVGGNRKEEGAHEKKSEKSVTGTQDGDVNEDVVEGSGDGDGVVKGKRRHRDRKRGQSKVTLEVPPDNGDRSLAEALAGRSEALAALGRHRLCLQDIRAALAQGYPLEDRHRLYARLAASCLALGLADLAAASARLENAAPGDAQRVADRAAEAAANQEQAQLRKSVELTGGAHAQLADASARLQLAETVASGRYVVAGEPLATGDTLLAQAPCAAVTFTEADASHCHHCLVRLEAPVGCERCSALAFCSERCRALASGYHGLECHFHDLLIGSGASALCRLGLRLITQRPLAFFTRLRAKMADRAPITESETYLQVHGLERHAQRRAGDDFLQRTIMALFLLRILQRAGYFPVASADDAESLNRDELLIGSLLLRHLQLLQFNAHEITETCVQTEGRAKGARQASIGIGVFPTASLFNHDCHPAVARHFVGSRMVLRTLRPVARGEAIGENYGPAFTRQPVALRQRALLSRYWFRCECTACRQDWPVLEKLSNVTFRFRCPTAGCVQTFPRKPGPVLNEDRAVRCVTCRQTISLADAMTAFSRAITRFAVGQERVEEGRNEEAIAEFTAFLDEAHRLGSPPFKDVHVAELTLRMCFALEGSCRVIVVAR